MASNNDSIQKTLLVAILLCLVCSIIVAGAAVSLKPLQIANKQLDKNKNILAAAGLLVEGESIEEQFKQITTRIVNLETSAYATDAELAEITAAGFNPDAFDQKKSSKAPELSSKLDADKDIASIKRLEKFAAIYTIEKDGNIETMVLPIHGYGLWSTLYGFIALEGDLETIVGLGFYSHGETPGLGGEVDNPSWKAQWVGKKLYDSQGELAIQVVKGKAAPGDVNSVDGLSGATLTSRGVSNLVNFWLGDDAFGTFLSTAKAGGA
ncbi:MAG: Na(+)-translocating NADH-quinone reductase subunit C [Oleispira antarctica]|nr:Na(+)-translocating NADH-quinone reductase subunit C [Oleispira antarctica]